MLGPVDAPVSEFKSRGINGEDVSQFEARKPAFMFAMNNSASVLRKWLYIIQKNFSITSGLRVRFAFENVPWFAGSIPRMWESSFA